MRGLLAYYVCILFPFALLLLAAKSSWVSSTWFVVLLFSYVLYRQCTDAWRLKALGVIDKVTLQTVANPFMQMKYFNQLYLGKIK